MVNLEHFFASTNDFTPRIIPEFLQTLKKLEELGLKSTYRLGGIPTFLGDLTDLILWTWITTCCLVRYPQNWLSFQI